MGRHPDCNRPLNPDFKQTEKGDGDERHALENDFLLDRHADPLLGRHAQFRCLGSRVRQLCGHGCSACHDPQCGLELTAVNLPTQAARWLPVFNNAITIGPGENAPSAALDDRLRKYPPGL